MNTKVVTAAVLGVIGGIIVGFMLANGLNRTEIDELRARVDRTEQSPDGRKPGDASNVSPEELRAKIAEADANPDNFSYQRNLGLALYRYASMKQDASLVVDSIRILERANSLDAKDYDVMVGLGNAYFDKGYFTKDQSAFEKARVVYAKALAAKPADADVITDVALSYFLADPPDLAKAVDEFNKAVKANPKHERALQFLTQAYLRQNNYGEAAKSLERLKAVNPKNETIATVSSQIAARDSAPVK